MKLEDKIITVMGLIIVIGYGYSVDMPQALEAPLREAPYSLSSIEINLLYFSTFLPVMFTDIPLGIVLDKYPMKVTVLVIAISSFLAQLACALLFDFRPDGYIYGVYVMRAISGMAGSSAYTMQGFVMARYASQHYETLMGFGLSLPYLFDALNVTIAPYIFDSTQSISLPWYLASAIDFLAVLSAIVISFIITRKQKQVKNQSLLRSQQASEEQQPVQEQFKASYLLQMPKLFWIIIFAMVVNEIAMCIFTNLNDLIINRFKMDYVTTGNLLIIPYVAGSIVALIFGRMLSLRPTMRRTSILLCTSLSTAGVTALYFLPNNSSSEQVNAGDYIVVVIFLILLSLMAGSMYTVLGSSISLLVDAKRLGTAWGVIGTAIGLGESISPIINGLVQNQSNLTQSYTTLTLIYMLVSVCSVAISLWIFLGPFSQIDINFHQSQAKAKEEQQSRLRATINTQDQ